MKRMFQSAVACAAIAVVFGSTASAEFINVDFGDDYLNLPSSYGAAGQVGSWNDITSLGTTVNLLDLSGAATDVSVTVTAYTISGHVGPPQTNDGTLLQDNFYVSEGAPWSVTFANLDAGLYDLYYYAPTNSSVDTGTFTVNGTSVSSLVGAYTLIQGTSWDVLSGVNVSGTATLSSTSTSGYRGLSGMQLVPTTSGVVPEPSSLALLGMGSLTLFGYRLRRKRKAELAAMMAARDALGGSKCPVPQAAADVCRRRLL